MPNFLALGLKATHWRILDAINAAPNGIATQVQIQAHFGPAAMMESLEQLYDAGHIENTMIQVRQGLPPKREPTKFIMSPAGKQMYDRNRKTAPAETDAPIGGGPVDDAPKRGRPPGAKNRPKETADQLAES